MPSGSSAFGAAVGLTFSGGISGSGMMSELVSLLCEDSSVKSSLSGVGMDTSSYFLMALVMTEGEGNISLSIPGDIARRGRSRSLPCELERERGSRGDDGDPDDVERSRHRGRLGEHA